MTPLSMRRQLKRSRILEVRFFQSFRSTTQAIRVGREDRATRVDAGCTGTPKSGVLFSLQDFYRAKFCSFNYQVGTQYICFLTSCQNAIRLTCVPEYSSHFSRKDFTRQQLLMLRLFKEYLESLSRIRTVY